MMRACFFILAVLLVMPPVRAVGPAFQEFPAAREAAAKLGVPFAVCVHGSSWQRASRKLLHELWRSAEFRRAIRERVVLGEVVVGQSLDEQQAKQQQQVNAGWNAKTVKTFPTIQVYSADGHLLRTLAGSELFTISSSADMVAGEIDLCVAAARRRQQLLTALRSLQQRPAEFLAQFAALQELPLDLQPDDLNLLKTVDPDDSLGLLGPLQFSGWGFIRDTQGKIADGVNEAELAEVDRLLANERYNPQQQCLLWCAKGMLLAAAGKPEEAWGAYQQAYALDPNGPDGKAVLRHAFRTVGRTLRVGVDPDTPLAGILTGGNLTTNKASFRLSSQDPVHDDPQKHRSLFAGDLQDFAFHTREEVSPAVLIDLGEICRVEAVEILNRHAHADRAADLMLWISTDGNSWNECWQAETVAKEWLVDLTTSPDGYRLARYLRLGLPPDRRGTLHLRAVNVFGLRPGEQPRQLVQSGAVEQSAVSLIRSAVTDDRLDVGQLLAGLERLAEEDELKAAEIVEGYGNELGLLERYARPRLWRSRDGKTVLARLLVVGEGEVTLDYRGLPTPIPRSRFSQGSERQLQQIEAAARTVAAGAR